MRAEPSVPREPSTAKGNPVRKGVLESMMVLSVTGRVIEAQGGHLRV
jgi:hypothetical protein